MKTPDPEREKMNESFNEVDDSGGTDFIRKIIEDDIKSNKHDGRIHTRFPPEPNGYLHIGHATAINLNFSVAKEYNGQCNLRYDDTDPEKESMEYVQSIQDDIKWLGFDWEDRLYFASDYFETLYSFAIALIKAGKAYVCDLSVEEISERRGTVTELGKNSPYRDRSIKENLRLFKGMKDGDFEDGSRVLRAKIDMSSPNMLLRDPVMYRIKRIPHYRTGTKWVIFPSYDWTHGQSDAIECITHSLCSLEFRAHRELYNWFRDELLKLKMLKCKPRQIEFSRLNLGYTVVSKRRLLTLVEEGHVSGWNDPRMPTLSGLRRRGYPASSIRAFLNLVGISKREKNIDIGLLESCVREELDRTSPRVMTVLDPLRIVIINYPEGKTEYFEAPVHPKNPTMGTRKIPFSRTLYIEKEDFMEYPPKKFYRLSPDQEVRLRYAYYIKCVNVVKNEAGEVIEIHCTYDPQTKGGYSPDGRKVKATLHWISIDHIVVAEARLYDRLFLKENPMEDSDFLDSLNPNSLTISPCYIEKSLAETAQKGETYQFERLGYFCIDSEDTTKDKLIINRTITLRDTWARMKKKSAH